MRRSISQPKSGYSRTSDDIDVVDGQIQRLQNVWAMLLSAEIVVLNA